MLFIDVKKGFSLLELILVLGVGTMVAFMKFQDMKNEQEQILANAVGQQMKQIGEEQSTVISIFVMIGYQRFLMRQETVPIRDQEPVQAAYVKLPIKLWLMKDYYPHRLMDTIS